MKILIAGDFCPQNRVAEKFEQGDYQSVLGEVKNVISSVDYAIVNFECPITKGGEKLIEKCGPSLQCSEKGLEAVKWAGFDCVNLANNHFLDFGKEGVENTLRVCQKYEIDNVGGGMNLQEASKTLYKRINGETLALINCCEHEFSIATDMTAGSNPLKPIQQYYAIQEARKKADYVLIIVHGGMEFFQLPTPRMKETYRFFVDAGVDAVVNHHQHCYSGFEEYKGCPIFYGIGNFCFDRKDKRTENWNKGYLVKLNLEKGKKVQYDIIPYIQSNETPTITLLNKEQEAENIKRFNKVINNDILLEESYFSFIEKNKEIYLLALEPYIGHLGGLRQRKLLPSLLTKGYFLRLYGYLRCEAHFDRLLEILKEKIYG